MTGRSFTTNYNIGSLDALTTYNVTVRATNNQNLYTELYTNDVTTGEQSKTIIHNQLLLIVSYYSFNILFYLSAATALQK